MAEKKLIGWCPACQHAFALRDPRQIYCSVECRGDYRRQKHRKADSGSHRLLNWYGTKASREECDPLPLDQLIRG